MKSKAKIKEKDSLEENKLKIKKTLKQLKIDKIKKCINSCIYLSLCVCVMMPFFFGVATNQSQKVLLECQYYLCLANVRIQ